jgi:hypothetical protein
MNARMIFVLVTLSVAAVSGYATSAHAAKPAVVRAEPIPSPSSLDWSLQVPQAQYVVYRGVVRFDDAGFPQSFMGYPAAGVADFGVGILAHALTSKAMRKAQKNSMQEKADEVLAPYRGFLEQFSNDDLFQRSLPLTVTGASKQLAGSDLSVVTAYRVHSAPVYAMTQDHSALALTNEIAIYAPDKPKKPVYLNKVHVVLPAQPAEDLQAYWSQGDGELLKSKSAKLLAVSLDLVLRDAAAVPGDGGEFKTIRYMEGTAKRMERAQVLAHGCGRLLLRTLRGTLMSVPEAEVATSEVENSCEEVGRVE